MKRDVVREIAARLADHRIGSDSRPRVDGNDAAKAAADTGPGGPEADPPAVASPAGSAVAIGSSGTEGPTHAARRRRGEPGGHPEDEPGDPEAVARAICLRLLTGCGPATSRTGGGAPAARHTGRGGGRGADRFVEVGLIDDRAYAEAFVAAKASGAGIRCDARCGTELRRKGVDEQIVDAAVARGRSRCRTGPGQSTDRARRRRRDGARRPAARRRLVGLLARRGLLGGARLSGGRRGARDYDDKATKRLNRSRPRPGPAGESRAALRSLPRPIVVVSGCGKGCKPRNRGDAVTTGLTRRRPRVGLTRRVWLLNLGDNRRVTSRAPQGCAADSGDRVAPPGVAGIAVS